MISKLTLREIILEQSQFIQNLSLGISRTKLIELEPFLAVPHTVFIAGVRRTGKSTLMRQIMNRHYKEKAYYFNFEDERLLNFAEDDFSSLYEIMLELYDERKVFFLDEIQSVTGWERFVRRMQDQGCKFFITGSNAQLLSRELGSKLTGRQITIALFPFSFIEFLEFNKCQFSKDMFYHARERVKLQKLFNLYLQEGGLPEYLTYQSRDLLKAFYEDILYKDIVARWEIKEIKALRELSLYYMSNLGAPISFNKLKDVLHLGSSTTVKSYTDYLENSFLFFTINCFSYSLKKQYIASKKIYSIDHGLASKMALSFSRNQGRLLENLVFIELKRRGHEVYYYKTRHDREVDFISTEGKTPNQLIQVCFDLSDKDVRYRETMALQEALEEMNLENGLILTFDTSEDIVMGKHVIFVRTVLQWLLGIV